MAALTPTCKACTREFRTANGLTWHKAHPETCTPVAKGQATPVQASKPKSALPTHQGECASVHEGVGHMRWAIRTVKIARDNVSGSRGPASPSVSARKSEAAIAKAEGKPTPTRSRAKPRVTAGLVKPENVTVVPAPTDLRTDLEALTRIVAHFASESNDRFEKLEDKIEALMAAYALRDGRLKIAS